MESANINTSSNTSSGITPKQAAVNGLAIVGFISLLVLGVGAAIYSTRYLPSLNLSERMSAATVYLSSIFDRGEDNLEVVPLPFGDETAPVATTTTATTTEQGDVTPVTPTTPAPVTPVPAQPRPTQPTQPYGLADLAVTSMTLGYLTTNSTDSFVASNEVPTGMRPAVRFIVTNVGTNVSGNWYFEADLPTSPGMTYTADTQLSLAPGQRIQYVLGFDRPAAGMNLSLTLRLDAGNQITESNELNNTVMPSLDIKF